MKFEFIFSEGLFVQNCQILNKKNIFTSNSKESCQWSSVLEDEEEVKVPTITTFVDGSFRDIAHLIKNDVKELFVYSNNTFLTSGSNTF